jgi:hypothetical protein
MLAANTYPKPYVADCRGNIERQLSARRQLLAAVRGKDANVNPAAQAAAASFDLLFFRNLVVVLDAFLVHRTRAREGKDGNPLNEVRMLCESILTGGGVLRANKSIKYDPTKSVLGLGVGATIELTDASFAQLSAAYFAAIEAKFV